MVKWGLHVETTLWWLGPGYRVVFPRKAMGTNGGWVHCGVSSQDTQEKNWSPQTPTAWVRARGHDKTSPAWVPNRTGTVAERGLPGLC